MTFRDDHDAAIARADALAEDLRRSEDERERLRAELALAREREVVAPAVAPSTLAEDLRRSEAERERLRAELDRERERVAARSLVLSRSVALTPQELKSLVAGLEAGGQVVVGERSKSAFGSVVVILMGAGTCFASLVAGFALIAVGLFFLVLTLAGHVGDHAAMIELVRDNPDQIYRVTEQTSAKGLRRIEIRTRAGALATFYPEDVTSVMQALARRCPKAIVG